MREGGIKSTCCCRKFGNLLACCYSLSPYPSHLGALQLIHSDDDAEAQKFLRSLNFTKRIITNNMVKTEEGTQKKKRKKGKPKEEEHIGKRAEDEEEKWETKFSTKLFVVIRKQRQQLKTARQREKEKRRKREKGNGGRGWIASGKLSHKEKFAQTNLKKIIITRTVSQNVPVPVPVRHRLHKFYSGCDRG